ncbi:MAG: DUF4190 domain-containing protein [Verrucomicrobiota bacterium]
MSESSSAPKHWSRTAVASPVLAILGFASLWLVVGLFISAAGAICGHVGKHHTANGAFRGRRLATLGTVLSYLSLLSFPVLILIVSLSFPAFELWKTERFASQREQSQSQATDLFLACESYARANQGRYPETWDQLSGRFLGAKELRDLLKSPYPDGKAVAFELIRHDRPVLDAIAESVIVIQEIAPSNQSAIAVVYANGSVKSIHNPDHQLP